MTDICYQPSDHAAYQQGYVSDLHVHVVYPLSGA